MVSVTLFSWKARGKVMIKFLLPLFIFVFSTQVTFINGSEIDPFEKYYNDVLKEHSLKSDGKNKNIHKKYFSILKLKHGNVIRL